MRETESSGSGRPGDASHDRPGARGAPPRPGARIFTWGAIALAAVAIAWITLRSERRMPPAPEEGAVRFATYNIRAGLGGIPGVTEDLRSLAADVIAVQEAEKGIYGSREIDQAKDLAAALGMRHVYAPSFSLEGREHGLAILSRFPLANAQTIPLPQGSGRWPRVALQARVETPHGPVRIICLHLTRPWRVPFSHTRERLAQLRAVFEAVEGDSLPRVVAGDFNSTPLSPERWLVSRHLLDSWIPWRDGWATTFPLTSIGLPAGAVKIDAVFHERTWRSRGMWVAPPGASDHRPVVADLAPEEAEKLGASAPSDPARIAASSSTPPRIAPEAP